MFSFHAWPPNQFFPQSATLDQGFLRICAQRRFPEVGSPAVAHSCDVLQHGYVQLGRFSGPGLGSREGSGSIMEMF